MAVRISFKVNDVEFDQTIRARGEQWAKAISRTMDDMRQRGPTQIAKSTAQVYALSSPHYNPNTEKGSGSVSLSGGLQDLTFVYRGKHLPITKFKVTPAAYPGNARAYKVRATILRGRRAVIGHWSKPDSEGGAYAGRSPWMYFGSIPGLRQRTGASIGGVMQAVSVPQMVHNADQLHGSGTVDRLNELMAKRLAHNLGRLA